MSYLFTGGTAWGSPSRGEWMIRPCYEVQAPGGGSNECPPEWNRFFVNAEP